MKKRICFLCEESLSFNDYIKTNTDLEEFLIYREITEKHSICKIIWIEDFKEWDLIKIWESNKIELACCHCRNFLEKVLNEKEILWEMLEWSNDKRVKKLKDLGILTQRELQDIKNNKNED